MSEHTRGLKSDRDHEFRWSQWDPELFIVCLHKITQLRKRASWKTLWTHLRPAGSLVKTNRSDKMRTILIFFHLTPILLLSNSFSILPRNESESFSSDESLSSAYGTLLFTYTIHRYPTNPDTNLSAEVIDEIIENAFSLWSSVSPFQFSRVDSDQHADVQLSFERGFHLRGRGHEILENVINVINVINDQQPLIAMINILHCMINFNLFHCWRAVSIIQTMHWL